MRTNRYDSKTGTLTLSAPEAAAFRKLVGHYTEFFWDPTTEHGLVTNAITSKTQLRQLTAFFAWTAWAAAARRPGHNTRTPTTGPRSRAWGTRRPRT